MHEVSIMTEALRMAVDAAHADGAARILKLRLRIGSLSGVVPESMQFAFDVVCQRHDGRGRELGNRNGAGGVLVRDVRGGV